MIDRRFDSLPPNSVDAEAAMIGVFAVANNLPDVRAEIAGLVPSSAALLTEAYRPLYEGALNLHRNSIPFDALILRENLVASGKWDADVSAIALAECLKTVMDASHGPHYARIVRDHYRRRWLSNEYQRAAECVWQPSSDPVQVAAQIKGLNDGFLRKALQSPNRDGGSGEVAELIRQTEIGLRRSIPFIFPLLSGLAKPLMPGTISIICGTPGDGKTFLVIALLLYLERMGIGAAARMLEGDRAYHLNRCLAVMTGDTRLLDDDRIRQMSGTASSLVQEHAETLERVGRAIFDSSQEDCTLAGLAKWVEREAPHNRVLIIDPISLAETGRDRYLDDGIFMQSVRQTIIKWGCSLVLITHPKAGANKKGPLTLDDLAGGAVYQRAAECVLMLKKHDQPKSMCLSNSDGAKFHRRVNRELRILKARNGPGGGMHLAYDFNPAKLMFEEFGMIICEEETSGVEP